MLTILRSIVLAMACLVVLSVPAPAPADQWDELARKFVDQEHAQFVRRAADNDGIVIVMAHALVTERVVLVVADGKAAMSFQFRSVAMPSNDAFELMARGGSLVTGKEAAVTIRLVRQSYAAARTKDDGLAMVNSDGLTVTCILSRESGGLSFLIAPD